MLAVAEVLTVPQLWRTLRDDEQHCAIVVNEYGSVVGMVTLEDAIEEILGEVHDEFDLEDEPISVVDGRVSVRGDVLLEMLDDRFDLDAASDEVDTVGGLVWQHLGRLPEVGDEVRRWNPTASSSASTRSTAEPWRGSASSSRGHR